ncbi:AraC family transcriptional regulator [Rasiella rasia]|uniref:AraC family transcriptional regulator n=1 Tax=Rasiella rasia TaxID=2744027 RepID=A0A6G6GK30_9FLAO|nr:helix-turn-helix domain-containing protein [Rasiella rasia]QIE58051.1 AraC family transcriptional regulator [Rasiella rasia]
MGINYNEYSPLPQLNSIVDSIWLATNFSRQIESRILPDGYIDLIFELNKETCDYSKNKIRVSGMMTKFNKVTSKKNSQTIGIRFKAGQFSALINIPISELKNQTISASDILPQLDYSIIEKLVQCKNNTTKINIINNFITERVKWSNTNKSKIELSVCKSIETNFQDIDLAKIAQEHFISLRQLERRFKAIVGVTMKEYHAITRFNKTMEHITTNPDTSLLNIAFDMGYFDHSHLTKEINKMSGLNPSEI